MSDNKNEYYDGIFLVSAPQKNVGLIEVDLPLVIFKFRALQRMSKEVCKGFLDPVIFPSVVTTVRDVMNSKKE